jgi:hypothetical protein
MGTFFSLSKSASSTALDISEITLLLFGVLLVAGLIGEYAKSERSKRRVKIFEMFVIIGVAGELLADGGIFLFSRHLQTIADLEIADLTKENTAAKQELEATFMRTRPRMIFDNKKFQDVLRGKPKADVEILFKPEDEEAWSLAIQIKARLTDVRLGTGAGWTVSTFRPLTKSDALPDAQLNRPEVPLAIKSGSWFGLGLVVRSAPYPCFSHEIDSSVCALQSALMASGVGGGQITFARMPDNVIKIIIGQEESGH